MKWLTSSALGLLAVLTVSESQASNTPTDWKTECVGRFLIGLPGEVDVALPRASYLYDGTVTNGYVNYVFIIGEPKHGGYLPDGTFYGAVSGDSKAWGSKQLVHGELVTGPTITPDGFSQFKADVGRFYEEKKQAYLKSHEDDYAKNIYPRPTDIPDAFAWSGPIYLMRGGRLFSYDYPGLWENPQSQERLRFVATSLRTRNLYEIPNEAGLCLHYAFLPEAPTYPDSRVIGVTYRLKDHPDVEIFFMDQTAQKKSPQSKHEMTAAEEVQFFWEDDYNPHEKQKRILNPHIPGVVQFPTVKLGGYEGKASFIETTHKDGSIDYGYMAYVKGDPDAKEDTPTLMLYVIRTAARAKGAPVSKDELKKLADQIAASIRRRPVH
ncbi:MAG: T6SS immunity protein Tli4 family protein [Formivibrio sp.]|nr:T6SS immunity protein Tli4 family protein [Formivibrio sp.]